jgi:hypothetical protein
MRTGGLQEGFTLRTGAVLMIIDGDQPDALDQAHVPYEYRSLSLASKGHLLPPQTFDGFSRYLSEANGIIVVTGGTQFERGHVAASHIVTGVHLPASLPSRDFVPPTHYFAVAKALFTGRLKSDYPNWNTAQRAGILVLADIDKLAPSHYRYLHELMQLRPPNQTTILTAESYLFFLQRENPRFVAAIRKAKQLCITLPLFDEFGSGDSA